MNIIYWIFSGLTKVLNYLFNEKINQTTNTNKSIAYILNSKSKLRKFFHIGIKKINIILKNKNIIYYLF
jgi:hypothetical protein